MYSTRDGFEGTGKERVRHVEPGEGNATEERSGRPELSMQRSSWLIKWEQNVYFVG